MYYVYYNIYYIYSHIQIAFTRTNEGQNEGLNRTDEGYWQDKNVKEAWEDCKRKMVKNENKRKQRIVSEMVTVLWRKENKNE